MAKPEAVHSRRHPEWREHQIRWRWLVDSLEGGNAYRQAIYGTDDQGFPVRNLIRHKREYPDPSELRDGAASRSTYGPGTALTVQAMGTVPGMAEDQAAHSTIDDYELRRARTPVPTFVKEAIETHLGKIYCREVERVSSSPDLTAWWGDVDGKGTVVGEWMVDMVAPVFLALGQVDILFDHPRAPAGSEVASRADVLRLGLDRCVASLVLPENVVWWRLDIRGHYAEAVVREFPDDARDDRSCTYRHWTAEGSTLYDSAGKVLETIPHNFGRCPLVRFLDRPKVRCRNVGQSRYEAIAERQREYYNRDSELILSDTLQAHPLLQAPEDYVQGDGSIPVGPGYLLPKKKTVSGTSVSYEGFDVVEFPKDEAESLRKNKDAIRDDVDRDAGLTKPAGAVGSTRGSVAQSGVSKRLDSVDGNARLASIARSLTRLERGMAEMALVVALERPDVSAELARVKLVYPTTFDLDSVQELTDGALAYQALLEAAGQSPEVEVLVLEKLARLLLPGRSDRVYDAIGQEIRLAVDHKAGMRQMTDEAGNNFRRAEVGQGSEDDAAQDDAEAVDAGAGD